jgi:uncharacterized phage protein (TIGR01671 family)
MREIKFRAWNKEKDIMYYPKIGNPIVGVYDEEPLEHYILMQYTGLKDKNGKRIYEGDIVKFRTERFGTGVSGEVTGIKKIVFENCYYNLEGCNVTCDNLESPQLSHMKEEELEVIGNVYETPELIE